MDNEAVSPESAVSPSVTPTPNSKRRKAGSPPAPPPKWKSILDILQHSAKGGLYSFVISYSIRAGFSFILRLIRVLQRKAGLGEAIRLSFLSIDPLRFGATLGSFSFIWKFISNTLNFYRQKHDRWNGAAAGAIAGLCILFEPKSTRVAFAEQLFVRAMQAFFNVLSVKGLFSFEHGDSLLFMLACGSIMYGYVMQPHTLPKSYYSWMVKTARIPADTLEFNRQLVRHVDAMPATAAAAAAAAPVVTSELFKDPLASMHALIAKHTPRNSPPGLLEATQASATAYVESHGLQLTPDIRIPNMSPCDLLHPSDPSCTRYSTNLFLKVARQIAPVYLALNLIPLALLRPLAAIRDPMHYIRKIAFSTARSSAFLGVYVAAYMTGICASRAVARAGWLKKDMRAWYYITGLISSGVSIFVEEKHRRGELVLYVLPKAAESLFLVLKNRGLAFDIPGIEVGLVSIAMSILMSVYQTDPSQMNGLLYRVMRQIFGAY